MQKALEAEPSDRIARWDNIKAVAIIMVVFGHTLQLLGFLEERFGYYVFSAIYLWHMPLFVFITGYFVSTKFDLSKTVSTLLIPYVLLEVLFSYLESIFTGAALIVSLQYPSYGMWFLLALAIWRMIWPSIYSMPHILKISIALALVAGYASYIGHTWTLSRALCFFPFFIFGFRSRQLLGEEKIDQFCREWLYVALGAIVLAAIVYSLIETHTNPHAWLYMRNSYSSLGFEQWWAASIRVAFLAGGVASIAIVILVMPIKESCLTKIGQNTFNIYIWHIVMLKVLSGLGLRSWFISIQENYPVLAWLSSILLCGLIVWFFSRRNIVALSEWLYWPHQKLAGHFSRPRA